MFVIRLVTYAVSEQPTQIYYWTLVGRFDQFLIGMLIAQICIRFTLTPRLSRLLLAVGAAAAGSRVDTLNEFSARQSVQRAAEASERR